MGTSKDAIETPTFVYFDLGRVLLHFDHAIACEQLAEAANTTPQVVREMVFETERQNQYERGEVTTAEFLQFFRTATGTDATDAALLHAAGAIFEPHVEVVALMERVGQRAPLGVLSNTCEAHWDYAWERFEFLRTNFRHYVLSYKVGAMKPSPEIYRAAAAMCDTEPAKLLFIDDLAANADAARDAGWDAIHFVSAPQLNDELSQRGLLD